MGTRCGRSGLKYKHVFWCCPLRITLMAATSERLLWVLCWACIFSEQLREIKTCAELRVKPRAVPSLAISSDHCSVAPPYPWPLSLWKAFQLFMQK